MRMQIAQALGIKNKDVVSLVGGGGKTTTMFQMAEELVEQGKRVVTTTTTRIFAAQIKLAPFHICAENDEEALRDLRAALKEHPHVLVIGTTNEEGRRSPSTPQVSGPRCPERSRGGKAFGVEPALVDKIAALEQVDVVINEADGSRMHPFKAPGDHEPVIPDSTTLLIPVVGVDVIGAPLDDEHVHRAERVAALASVKLGTTVDPELVARVIAHPEGGLKNCPLHARVIPLINKTQNVAQLVAGRDLAGRLLRHDAIDAVALGAVRNTALPIAELHQRVAAIVLAAGGSTRMQGQLKQLLSWGDATLVRHTVEVAQRAQVAETIVVVGRQAANVKQALAGIPLTAVFNPEWETGRASSVRAGLNALGSNIAAAIFINADQPFLTPQVVDTIVQRYAQTRAPIVVPIYAGQTGSPVLFAQELFDELRQLRGEDGGKKILQARRAQAERVNILNVRAATDVDTPEEYEVARAEAEANPAEGIFSTTPKA
jgi:molybdenum cofactor cytidylyltransferase